MAQTWADVVRRLWVIGDGVPSFEFDAVISESHTSRLLVMDNPVETGFIVSDHAVMMPYQLEISAVVSDVWLRMRRADKDNVGELNTDKEWLIPEGEDADATGRAQRAYELMLGLQQSANPFNVITGLTLVENVLCEEITANQDKRTAGALIFQAKLRGVMIVDTETVVYPPRADKKTTINASKKTTKGQQQAVEPPKEKQASLLVKGGRAVGKMLP